MQRMLRDAETANIPFSAVLTGALRRCSSLVWPATRRSERLALHPASTAENGTLTISASLKIGLPIFFALLQNAQAACVPLPVVVDGRERQALVCANRPTGSAAPLVLAFHGRGGSAENMASGTQIHEAWPEAIVAYAEGLTGNPAPYDPQGIRRGWQINPGDLDDRDVRFVDALLDALIEKYKPDVSRIYAVGHSNGARFTGILWALRAPRFAAFAFSAGQAGTLIEKAQLKPVFMSMGRRDEIVPFALQWPSIGYARTLLKTQANSAFEYGYLRTEQGVNGTELMTWIHPGGHAWPEMQTRHTVNFFKRHRLPSTP